MKQSSKQLYEVTVYLSPQTYTFEAKNEEEAALAASEKFGDYAHLGIEDVQVELKPEDPDACQAHPFLWRDNCKDCSDKLRERVEAANVKD